MSTLQGEEIVFQSHPHPFISITRGNSRRQERVACIDRLRITGFNAVLRSPQGKPDGGRGRAEIMRTIYAPIVCLDDWAAIGLILARVAMQREEESRRDELRGILTYLHI